MRRIVLVACAVLLAAGAAAETKPARKAKAAPVAAPGPAAPDCPRAAYKGDPVCFGEEDGKSLPTPSAGAIWRDKSDDVRLNDEMTVSGADPAQMKKTPVDQYLNNPNPNPRKQTMGGGAAVNYKF